jgi:hypothetical protein
MTEENTQGGRNIRPCLGDLQGLEAKKQALDKNDLRFSEMNRMLPQGVFSAFSGKSGMFPSAKKIADGNERMKERQAHCENTLSEAGLMN